MKPFTRGPWRYQLGSIVDSEGYLIADVRSRFDDGMEGDDYHHGNAALLAQAPDMLRLLKAALPIIDVYRRASGGDGDIAAMNIRSVLASPNNHYFAEDDMNDQRRERLAEAIDALANIRTALEAVRDEKQEAFDSTPESLQGAERGEKMEEAITLLDDAINDIDPIVDAITSATA